MSLPSSKTLQTMPEIGVLQEELHAQTNKQFKFFMFYLFIQNERQKANNNSSEY